jgi:hypothetical protein
MSNASNDATRTACAVLAEELEHLAKQLASLLRTDAPLPGLVVGKLVVDLDKMQGKLQRHAGRLQPPSAKP